MPNHGNVFQMFWKILIIIFTIINAWVICSPFSLSPWNLARTPFSAIALDARAGENVVHKKWFHEFPYRISKARALPLSIFLFIFCSSSITISIWFAFIFFSLPINFNKIVQREKEIAEENVQMSITIIVLLPWAITRQQSFDASLMRSPRVLFPFFPIYSFFNVQYAESMNEKVRIFFFF